MTIHSPNKADGSSFNLARSGFWIAIVIVASVAFSLSLACAMPFAAVAALAALKMPRGEALTLTACAWLTNQFIGFFILHYPQTWDSFAWGAAIGIAALLATFGAEESLRLGGNRFARYALVFVGAFIIYEGALYASTAFLPSSPDAFSFRIVSRVFEISVVAFAGLLILHRIALMVGVASDSKPALGHRFGASRT